MGEQGPEMNQRPGGGARAGEGAAAPKGPRLELSVAQVAGSAVAAVAAAVLASRLGVYGTIIGAGVVSVVATCGGPVFQHMLRRTGEQLREVTVQGRPGGRRLSAPGDSPGGPRGEAPLGDGEFGVPTTHGTRVRGWKRPVLAATGVFVVTMGGITGYELISGHGLSGGAATTVGSAVRGGGGGGDDTPATPSGTPSGSTGSPDPGQEQEQGPASDTPAPGGGTGTDPSGSPGGGPGEGPGQDGSADPSRTPSPAPSHSGSGSGPSSSAPAPTPSDGGGASSRDSHPAAPGR
ncbi:hypothetical protein AB0O64_29065 [Streptomyces sp. NPDC088341]|uniref:hypothetical protein n=1 Tax=Streptomyces sp. NPDC088341 TaxID=3154870 RepID=UPI00342714D2